MPTRGGSAEELLCREELELIPRNVSRQPGTGALSKPARTLKGQEGSRLLSARLLVSR